MDKYRFQIVMTVEVEAFDEMDALDSLHDTFAPSEMTGDINVVSVDINGE